MKSIFLTSRHEFIFYSALFLKIVVFYPEADIFLQCSPFGEVDLFDPEARIYLLQCSSLWWALSFDEVDLLDPEACEVIFYSALLVVESILWTPRHEFI